MTAPNTSTAPKAWIEPRFSALQFAKRTLGRYLVVALLLSAAFAYSEIWKGLAAQQDAQARSNLLERIDREDDYMAKLQAEKEAKLHTSMAHHHPPRSQAMKPVTRR